MIYKFLLAYAPTEGTAPDPRTVRPIYGDNLQVVIARADGEWFYTRRIEGDIIFHSQDYDWLMSQPFDGTYTLTIRYSTNNGSTWNDYFSATFARTNLTIDEDNRHATLSGLTETAYNTIENGKDDEYDLRKLIPDTELREVQASIPPALAIIDFRLNTDHSDLFAGGPVVSGGFKDGTEFKSDEYIGTDWRFLLNGIYVEAKVLMLDHSHPAEGTYTGIFSYRNVSDNDFEAVTPLGTLSGPNNYKLSLQADIDAAGNFIEMVNLLDANNITISSHLIYTDRTIPPLTDWDNPPAYSPSSLSFDNSAASSAVLHQNISMNFHYILSSILSYSPNPTVFGIPIACNLNCGPYYHFQKAFEGSGLTITQSITTSDQPNGHRLVPGTDNRYFAPPDNSGWIPLAEYQWNFASMWYKIVPSQQNGLTNPDLFGTHRFPYCFTLGTALHYLLDRISDHRVSFNQSVYNSHFLYESINPLTGGENFSYLITQKSNVMHPAASGASTCKVTLNWLLKLLRNAFNCYYWLEPTNIGTYNFHVEHVEYFRRGGRYEGDFSHTIDLTSLMPRKNFFRNNAPVKCLADQTNHYSYDIKDLSEKYTFSWQGEGGGDDFKGNPMFFRAGWIEKSSSESHEVDNIFADLSWLMLNAGTETESARNYDGIFLFATYRYARLRSPWAENSAPLSQILMIDEGRQLTAYINIYLSIPVGQEVTVYKDSTATVYTHTASTQVITIMVDDLFISGNHQLYVDFGPDYQNVIIHRIHAIFGNVFAVANTPNLLRPGSTLTNGALSWPHLQNEYLHYDIPAQRWSFDTDDLSTAQFIPSGTVKMAKRQEVKILPIPDYATEQQIMNIIGIRTGLGTGIITSATINLASRNAELTILYDPIPNNQ